MYRPERLAVSARSQEYALLENIRLGAAVRFFRSGAASRWAVSMLLRQSTLAPQHGTLAMSSHRAIGQLESNRTLPAFLACI